MSSRYPSCPDPDPEMKNPSYNPLVKLAIGTVTWIHLFAEKLVLIKVESLTLDPLACMLPPEPSEAILK